MRLENARLLATAFAVMAAATLNVAACILHRQAEDNAAFGSVETIAAARRARDDRPTPGWLHVRGVPGRGQGGALRALTSGSPAATIHWWMPLP